MEEAKNILKELMIDWDQCVYENFNPLQLAMKLHFNANLHKDFHTMLYRLEQIMDKIVISNLTGFSEAFKIFERYKNTNMEVLNGYSFIEEKLDGLVIMDDSSGDQFLGKFNTETPEFKAKYDLCAMIVDARNLYKSFLVSEDPEVKSKAIVRALTILGDRKISQIKGAFEYYKIVWKSYQMYSDEVSRNLLRFIINNEPENTLFFNIIISLETISRFDDYCQQNFQKEVFKLFEGFILEIKETAVYTNDEHPDPVMGKCGSETYLNNEKIAKTSTTNAILDLLCEKIANSIEWIVENMDFITNKSSNLFIQADQEDFFGRKKARINFIFDRSGCIAAIKTVLKKFIERYAFEPEKNENLDMGHILDVTDYSKIYDENSSILQRIANNSKKMAVTNENFTLITIVTTEVVSYLLKHIKNHEIKSYISQVIETKLFSDAMVEQKIGRIRNLLENITEDNYTKMLAEGHTNFFSVRIRSFVEIELTEILDNCIAVEEERRVKLYLRKSLFFFLLHLYDKLFVSTFIKEDSFKDFLNRIDQYYNQKPLNSPGGDSDKRFPIFDEDEESIFGVKNYSATAFVVSLDQFEKLLVDRHISKSDLFLNPRKYIGLTSLINLLKLLKDRFSCKEIFFLIDLYELSLLRQLLLDFFYYFDLLYRQSSYYYYLKPCCEILEIENGLPEDGRRDIFVKDFETCFSSYCKNNIPSIFVKNRKELEQFIDVLGIFAENISERIDISGVVEFFQDVLKGRPKGAQGKMLRQKIS